MKGLVAALLFMTRLPLPRRIARIADFDRLMPWLPAAGLVVGVPVMASGLLLYPHDPWVAALFALLAWIGMTGALHLDGLADVVDGLGAAHGDPERLSKVMADPHIGSFGVVAIGAQIATKLVLLHAAIVGEAWLPLLFIPVVARIGPIFWTLSLPPLHGGLASGLRSGTKPRHLLIWLGLLGLSSIIAPVPLAALPALIAWHVFVSRKLGGISGDSHGAGIELTESWLLLCVVAAGWVR
ncbi:adenosylcobinamide-GDP ribazoletransferase [Rhizorhabdus sp. FW153]|uniref:adenosylcobinamide-GDP ribazoletransferase n=1 Tax=Rhizorhabdus sp. FW153 TaxID=3400216 RepID=UPI003CFA0E07